MPKFKKRPSVGVVEAEQWFPQNEDTDELPMPAVFREHHSYGPGFDYFVLTIHKQRVYLEPGDWVIREPDDIHFYSCKPDIFEATYEPVEEEQ